MAIITTERILKVLTSYNPWWQTGTVNKELTPKYKRFAYHMAMDRLLKTDIRRTIVLTGVRRVGKTTIEYQMIDKLLQEGVPPQRILFDSLDHPISVQTMMYIISLMKYNTLQIGPNGLKSCMTPSPTPKWWLPVRQVLP